MSKKRNKKFKRSKIAGEKSESNQTFTSNDPVLSEESISSKVEKSETPAETGAVDPYTHNQYDHVKKDVRKILLIILGLAIVFVAIFFLGEKTNILKSFGDWIYKVTNLQTS